MDRLQSMCVFAKVVEQGSFARAAQALDISNAVATRHVANLEEHLGTRLLNRTTRKLSLTETGHAYLERVLQILQEVEDAEAIASAQSKKPGGTLRIYSHLGFGQLQLARLLPQYSQTYPDVLLDVTLSDRAPDLVEDRIDVGIFINLQKFDASMIARQIGLAVMVRPSFALRDDLATGRLVRLLQAHQLGHLPVVMLYPSRRLLSAKVRSFVDFMSKQFPRPESDPWQVADSAA